MQPSLLIRNLKTTFPLSIFSVQRIPSWPLWTNLSHLSSLSGISRVQVYRPARLYTEVETRVSLWLEPCPARGLAFRGGPARLLAQVAGNT
jgi:hypothetical protein